MAYLLPLHADKVNALNQRFGVAKRRARAASTATPQPKISAPAPRKAAAPAAPRSPEQIAAHQAAQQADLAAQQARKAAAGARFNASTPTPGALTGDAPEPGDAAAAILASNLQPGQRYAGQVS